MTNTGYTFDRVKLTQDEQTCILALLRDARVNDNEVWHPVIDSIVSKYTKRKYRNITEAQHWQTA